MRDATISRSKRLKEPPRIGFARRLRRAAERLLRERRLARDIGHRIADSFLLLRHHRRMLAEFDDLLGRVADDEERVPACRDRRQRIAHHAAHQNDAPVGRAKMFLSAVGDDALLLNRHAVLVAYVDAPPVARQFAVLAKFVFLAHEAERSFVARIEAQKIEEIE
jgi:hypothetical protein